MNAESRISLRALDSQEFPTWLSLAAPALDRLLGIHTLDRLYRRHRLQNLPPYEFIARTLALLDLEVCSSPEDLNERVPARGPLIVVSNHPFGAVEALALTQVLKSIRGDIKFLANAGLGVFRELRPLFIATNPFKITPRNQASIRACESHLTAGGALVLFPAGKVSYRPRGEPRIRDAEWNRIVGHLARRTGATLLPVFFHGANSPLFQTLGQLWDRSKLLLLPREFLRLRGRRIHVEIGRPLGEESWRGMDAVTLTRFARAMTYLLEKAPAPAPAPAAPACSRDATPLAPLGDPARIADELAALPAAQRLLDFKQFSVFHAAAAQIPLLMDDIARERERVFRLHDEGSGAARDGDDFDQRYEQLFVWDHQSLSLVGAYRMGRTDELRQPGAGGAYLARMFTFDAAFYDTEPPSLEMGRSFVVPERQKHYYALYLLWQGIGRYLAAHPRYRRLYGTVSLSRQYDERAIALMCDALITPSPLVRPRYPLNYTLHPEWLDFMAVARGGLDLAAISALVRGVDRQGKDVPILLKHYHKLGARFHCVGIDPNFNDTPGLLLSVDMDALSPKQLSTFLGPGAEGYRAWRQA